MSASGSGGSWLDRAIDDNIGPSTAIRRGIAGIILSMAGAAVMIVDGAADGLTQLFEVLDAVRQFFASIFLEGRDILGAGSEASQQALGGFGIEGFVVAIGVIAVGYIVWTTIDPDLPLVDRWIPWR